MEDNLRCLLTLADGGWLFLRKHPLTATILTIAVIIYLPPRLVEWLSRRRVAAAATAASQ